MLGSASDSDSSQLFIENLVSDAGQITDNGDGSWTFILSQGWSGDVSFHFEISDGTSRVDSSATISATLLPSLQLGTDNSFDGINDPVYWQPIELDIDVTTPAAPLAKPLALSAPLTAEATTSATIAAVTTADDATDEEAEQHQDEESEQPSQDGASQPSEEPEPINRTTSTPQTLPATASAQPTKVQAVTGPTMPQPASHKALISLGDIQVKQRLRAEFELQLPPLWEQDDSSYHQQMEQLRDQVEQDTSLSVGTIGGAFAVSAGVSAGYVAWLSRGGVLMSSTLTAVPVWRLVDPLPVLASLQQADSDDNESLQSLIEDRRQTEER